MAKFELFEVTTREEMDEIAPVVFAAFHDPYRPEYQFLHPMFGHPNRVFADAVEQSQERRWKSYKANPASHWIAVRETATGRVAAAVEWLFFDKNPFPLGPRQTYEATWWPPGEAREFTERIIAESYRPRASLMQRKHAALNSMAVRPDYRGHGLGRLMMDWGIKRADELQLECCIEASTSGRRLYEQYGLKVLFAITIDTDKPDAGDEWRACQSMYGFTKIFIMWRPKGGVWREDGPQGPWDVIAGKS